MKDDVRQFWLQLAWAYDTENIAERERIQRRMSAYLADNSHVVGLIEYTAARSEGIVSQDFMMTHLRVANSQDCPNS